MLDQQQRNAIAADAFEQQFQRRRLGGVHAGRGFVQRQQLGLGGERTRNFETALIAIRQIARELIGVTRNAAVIEQLVRA